MGLRYEKQDSGFLQVLMKSPFQPQEFCWSRYSGLDLLLVTPIFAILFQIYLLGSRWNLALTFELLHQQQTKTSVLFTPCWVEWKLQRTTTNPPNWEARVPIRSFAHCLKELIKIQASSHLNLLNQLWVFWGKPSLYSILLPLHGSHLNKHCSRDRTGNCLKVPCVSGEDSWWLQRGLDGSQTEIPGCHMSCYSPGGSPISAMGCNIPRIGFLAQPCLFTSLGTAGPAWPEHNVDGYAIAPF